MVHSIPNAQGVIVTRQGYPIIPNISIPPGTISINISKNGEVSAYVNDQTEANILGQIPIFTFANPPGLNSVGENFYIETDASGSPISNIAGRR